MECIQIEEHTTKRNKKKRIKGKHRIFRSVCMLMCAALYLVSFIFLIVSVYWSSEETQLRIEISIPAWELTGGLAFAGLLIALVFACVNERQSRMELKISKMAGAICSLRKGIRTQNKALERELPGNNMDTENYEQFPEDEMTEILISVKQDGNHIQKRAAAGKRMGRKRRKRRKKGITGKR